jgi:hypothetical protein
VKKTKRTSLILGPKSASFLSVIGEPIHTISIAVAHSDPTSHQSHSAVSITQKLSPLDAEHLKNGGMLTVGIRLSGASITISKRR